MKDFKGYPEALSGGGWLMSSPEVPGDLKAMGFDILSHANNHGTDWGVAGLLETDRRLSAAGLAHARERPVAYDGARTGLLRRQSRTRRADRDGSALDRYGAGAGRHGRCQCAAGREPAAL